MQRPQPPIRNRSPRGFLRLFTFVCVAAGIAPILTGCGNTTYPSLNGNWSMSAISSQLPGEPPQLFNGTVSSNGNSVTGTLYFSNSCFGSQAMLQFSGSIASGDELKITSQAYNNQIVFLTGTLSTDGSLLTGGSYTVSANKSSQPSCDNGDTGSLSGARLAAVNGTFAGSLTSSVTGTTYAATAQLTQASSATNGIYGVTGTFSLSGLSCFSSGSITAGTLVGNHLTLTATSGNASLKLQGTVNAAAQEVTVTTYTLSGGSCATDSGTGALTLQ
jgi:hypothetical protein